jgi:uncharacterized protein with FMN-binding domain
MGTRELKKTRKPMPRKAKVGAIATGSILLGYLITPLFAAAETSLPLPPDVDPTLTTLDVTSGTTVRVANAAMSLVTTSDKSVVTPGSTVTYKYVLTDTGNTAFKNVQIEDDKCSPIGAWTGNDTDPLLNIGEVWTATCKTTVLKDQTNKAKVTATPVLSDVVVTPSATPTPTGSTSPPAAGLKDGTFSGPLVQIVGGDCPSNICGAISTSMIVAGGKITSITVTPTPTAYAESTSRIISNAAIPELVSQALAAQSASIAGSSGATWTSTSFKTSIAAALVAAAA